MWDLRKSVSSKDAKEEKNAVKSLQDNEFKHLDLVWKPLVKIHINAPQQTTYLTPSTVSLFECFKNISVVGSEDKDRLPEKASSAKNLTHLNTICTDYYAGTDDGILVKSQIRYEKDNESGKMAPAKAKWVQQAHDGCIKSIIPNPMFPKVILAVGGWNFSVWSLTDESSESGASNTPLIKSGLGKTRYSAGQWSETRPSCFYRRVLIK